MKTKHFYQSVERKNTHSVKWDLIELQKYPEDVIPLWVADMDFKTDPHVVEALQKKIDHQVFGYHLPVDGYHKAVVEWCRIRHDADFSDAIIIDTFGVVNGIATSIAALTQPNDHILIFEPVYHPFKRLIEDNDRITTISQLVFNQTQYSINYKELEQLIQEDDVKMLIFCSPHNPVGRVWLPSELSKLMEICIQNNVIVLNDEIHMDFIYPNHKHHMLATLDKRYQNHVLTFISASKTFNLADTKIAQLLLYNQEYASKIKEIYKRFGLSSSSGWSQVAQEAAYKRGHEYVDQLMKVIVSNKELVTRLLEEANSKIKVIEPEGTYLLWLDFRAYKKDPKQIMDQLLYQARVWLNDGSIFGESGNGFFRMNLASTPERLMEATLRILEVFDETKV